MAKKPFRYPSKSHFDYDSGGNGVFDKGSITSRFDERRRSNNNISVMESSFHGMSRASSTESLLDDLSIRATNVFQTLDPQGNGFIKQEDLFAINCDLEEDELMDVFSQLDLDNDGCINLDDFKAGLRLISKTMSRKNIERRRSRVSSLSGWSPNHEHEQKTSISARGKLSSIGNSLDEGISVFSCGERMSDFYESISQNNPELAEQFNDLVDLMVKDVKELIMDKHFLNASFQKEKAAFENQIRQLEEEYESQISQICETETRIEAERIEKEFRNLMQKKQEEIQNLKEMLTAAEEMSKNASTATSNTSMEMKEELAKLQRENNNLQVQLSASQTECAVIRSEQVTMKQQFQERISQLQQEKNNLHSYENDWQNLTKQLQMLRDINRKLQDTNDSLRSAIESSPSTEIMRKISSHSAPSKSYNALNNNLLLCDPAYYKIQKKKGFERCESVTHDSIIDEHAGDSGLSTLRDVAELESEMQPINAFIDIYESQSKNTLKEVCHDCQTNSFNSMEHTMISRPNSLQKDSKKENLSGNLSYGTHKKTRVKERRRQQYSRERSSQPRGDASDSEYPGDNCNNDFDPHVVAKTIKTIMPERVFKIVFAGDASVGKSTFIMRLCTDSFVSDCQTTIGIDFRNKTVEVDDKLIGLQLWDTAGQERFRSMTANYFRKADGVLLLYDCTYQESFINVRNWVESIRTAAGDDIPIVLVSNKCDMIGRFEQEGRKVVSMELGQQLAKDNKLIFTEASAKSGQNIQETIEELARLLAKNEDLQSSKIEVHLTKDAPQTSKMTSQCCK